MALKKTKKITYLYVKFKYINKKEKIKNNVYFFFERELCSFF